MIKTGLILWAGNDEDHDNHLHIEGLPKLTGEPPLDYPGMTNSLWSIWIALHEQFGKSAYFLDDDTDDTDWTHMGWYNRRPIAGTDIWSQHAYANALDVGPYIGVKAQQPFYDFLTGKMIEEGITLLPIDKQSDRESIRHIQEMLGIRATGIWDNTTATAVKALAERSGTGDPAGFKNVLEDDGSVKTFHRINGRMYTHLLDERYKQGDPQSIYGTTVKLARP